MGLGHLERLVKAMVTPVLADHLLVPQGIGQPG
jgi:hypothetical protein